MFFGMCKESTCDWFLCTQQLDINIEMEFPYAENITEADAAYNCTTGSGAADRGVLGPFGLLIFADDKLEEQTAVFFYVAKSSNGDFKTHFCHDGSRYDWLSVLWIIEINKNE